MADNDYPSNSRMMFPFEKGVTPSVPPEPPTLSASDTAQMVRMLGLERDEMRNGWWLPAEPGPVFCTSIPHAVAEWQRLFENDHERAVAALRAEVAELKQQRDDWRAAAWSTLGAIEGKAAKLESLAARWASQPENER